MNSIFSNFSSTLLINPAYPEEFCEYAKRTLEPLLPEHLWVSTSGSQEAKWVALSKEAILHSALAVNDHLGLTAEDSWLHCLPSFHVGGIGIWARAWLSGAKVFPLEGRWQCDQFCRALAESGARLTSLVPTQVHDLIQASKRPPTTLRLVIVGGGALSPATYAAAQALGWPLILTFGMTEAASQVATSTLNDPTLQLLSHIEGREVNGQLAIRTPSLLSAYAKFTPAGPILWDPKVEGWFLTDDRVLLQERSLIPLGRSGRVLKIGGENVDCDALEKKLHALSHNSPHLTLLPLPDRRLGYVITLVATPESPYPIEEIIAQFNSTVLPFERIRRCYQVEKIPRSPLDKVEWKMLERLCQ